MVFFMFYDRFIELCNEKGIRPTPLVVGMGLSSSNVSQWKKGSTPRPEVLQRLAEYFGVSVSYLMFGDDVQKEKPDLNEAGPGKQELLRRMEHMNTSGRL